jgi:hypothetical protein
MRWCLALALATTLLTSGCVPNSNGTSSSGARSIDATAALTGTWRAVDATPLVQLDFSPGGVVHQRLVGQPEPASVQVGTWRLHKPGEIFTSQVRLGLPNVHAAYNFHIDGNRLVLVWAKGAGGPDDPRDNDIPWLAGVDHPSIALSR